MSFVIRRNNLSPRCVIILPRVFHRLSWLISARRVALKYHGYIFVVSISFAMKLHSFDRVSYKLRRSHMYNISGNGWDFHKWFPWPLLFTEMEHGFWSSYSSANKNFPILRRYRSALLNGAMVCIGKLRTGSRSAGYKYSLLMHCIKIKSPAKSLLNEQYVFVGGNISFLCVLSCSSEEA